MREVRTMLFWRAVAAEFVGMLLFIFAGLSTIVGGGQPGTALELKVSLSLGHVSGAHLNPAVTLGLMFSCQISAVRCVCYILAQMVGAVTASVIVNSYKPGEALGVNQLNVGVGAGFIIEFFATLQLVLWGSAPLAIGLSVGLGHFAAISFTGCGINPARSFGPALIQGKMKDHWVRSKSKCLLFYFIFKDTSERNIFWSEEWIDRNQKYLLKLHQCQSKLATEYNTTYLLSKCMGNEGENLFCVTIKSTPAAD
uniref:Uncharacterized protein n=1 Tax=Salarias fasciatus TaxID=181472 RepID=A0A672GR09_SALFA